MVAEVAVLAFPVKSPVTFAVIIPAAKLPDPSLNTIVLIVLVAVAEVAEFDTLLAAVIVANLASVIVASAISILTIVPSAILAEVTASAAILAEVTASEAILIEVTASVVNLAEVTSASFKSAAKIVPSSILEEVILLSPMTVAPALLMVTSPDMSTAIALFNSLPTKIFPEDKFKASDPMPDIACSVMAITLPFLSSVILGIIVASPQVEVAVPLLKTSVNAVTPFLSNVISPETALACALFEALPIKILPSFKIASQVEISEPNLLSAFPILVS